MTLWTHAWRDLRSHSLRYLLIGFSMLVGVLAISGVAVFNSTISDALVATEERENGRAASYSLIVPDAHQLAERSWASEETRLDQLAHRINTVSDPPLVSLGAFVDTKADMSVPRGMLTNRAPIQGAVRWVLGDYTALYRLPVVEGAFLTGDGAFPAEVALNRAAASQLNVTLGEEVTLGAAVVQSAQAGTLARGITYRIAAIVDDGKTDTQVYAPLSTLSALDPDALRGAYLTLRAVAPSTWGNYMQEILPAELSRLDIEVSEPVRRVDSVETVTEQLVLISSLFAVAGVFVLVITISGIANVGLATVKERARELSIRQAFGATPAQILAQVFGAALVLGCLVAVLGAMLTALGVVSVLPEFFVTDSAIETPGFPWLACGVAAGTALATTVVGNLIPAVIALRLPIARILRG